LNHPTLTTPDDPVNPYTCTSSGKGPCVKGQEMTGYPIWLGSP